MYKKILANSNNNKNNNLESPHIINESILAKKNLKYFPITSNNNQENNIIYLVAEDMPDLELNKKNQKNLFNSVNNINNKKIKRNFSTNNFNNINNQFIPNSTQKIYDRNYNNDNYEFNSNKKIIHSYSVDNYSSITNKVFDIFGNNLKILEKSKIIEKNFINGIKDKKRKDDLLNALNIYNKYKSLGKTDQINRINKSFNFETENNNKKNMSKIKTIINQKKGYNIILEDENENCENDTINSKRDKNKINNNQIYYNKNKDIQNLINAKTNQKNNIIKNRNNHKFLKNSNSINYFNTENNNNNKISIIQQQKYIKPIPKSLNKVYIKNFNSQNKNINININNNINNSININNNFNINAQQKTPGKILIRKIMREEKYIIDKNGHKKLLEINQSKISDENKNIPRKIRYHRNNPKIIVIDNNNAKNNIIKRYYRNNMSQINNNSFTKSKTSCNSIKKEKKIIKRIKNIPNPINSLFNINNNYNISEINNNHCYHEIKYINKKSKKSDSKTIYHDYTNITNDIIFNNINNINENKNKNIKNNSYKNIMTRNNSKSYYNIYNDTSYQLKNKSERNINNNKIIYRNINHNFNKIPYNNNVYLTEENNINYIEKNKSRQNPLFYYY